MGSARPTSTYINYRSIPYCNIDYVIHSPAATEDIQPVRAEAFDRGLGVLSRQSTLASKAVQLELLPRAVVRRDGLADLISLEQMHVKVQLLNNVFSKYYLTLTPLFSVPGAG